jgi:hypothetical protein
MSKKHTSVVKYIEGLDDLYIDLPGALFAEMGWDENTKLMWVINDNGNVCLRPPKHDTEPGIPVEFISFLESEDKNDSSNEA